MVASGVHIGGEEVTHLADLQDQCAKTLKAGPEPLTVPERRWARYRLTDLLDDLTHATDAGERAVIAAALWIAVAEDHLTLRGRWRGTGKWLLRQLRDADAGFAQRWLDAGNDPEKTAEIAREVLTALGGPLFDGYHAGGESPES